MQVKVEEKGDGVQLTLSGASAKEGMQSRLKQFAASVEEQLTRWARGEVARTIAVLELRMRQASRERDLLKQERLDLVLWDQTIPFSHLGEASRWCGS